MICQVRHLRRDSIARWPSIYNAPISRERYLRIVAPERKATLPVQAIMGRCGKCGYRLAWVLVRGKWLTRQSALLRLIFRLLTMYIARQCIDVPGSAPTTRTVNDRSCKARAVNEPVHHVREAAMKSIRLVVFLLALYALTLPASAATLVVLNKSEHTASLIDPDTGKTMAKLPVGRGPHEVIVSPDGRTAYVSNFGPYGICPPGDTMCKTPGNTITVLDLAERKVKATYDYGSNKGQHGSVISRDGKYVWVTSETPQSLLEIDTATGKIANQWMTKQERSHLVVVTPDEKKFYVTNTISGSVSAIERATGAVKVISIGKGAEAITISPDGHEVWVGMPVDNKIAVISTAKDEVVEMLDSGGKQPQRIRFTPDGNEVWVSHVAADTLTVIDSNSRKIVANVSVGKRPQGIVFSPDGHRGYFALSGSNQVAVIDVPGRKLVENFETGLDPDGIGWGR